LSASPTGLLIQAANQRSTIKHRQPGHFETEQITLPIEALAACAGTPNDPVTIESVAGNQVCLRWEHRGVAQSQVYDECRERILDASPQVPETLALNDPALLTVLEMAMDMTDRNPNRSATDSVFLQGKTGKIMATDCRQAAVFDQGFSFPWEDDVLVPHTEIFGFADFPAGERVAIGATASHVCLQIGPWTIHLTKVTERRYPDVERACPPPDAIATRVHVTPEDSSLLAKLLPQLPSRSEDDSPVTVDCNGRFMIRAKEPNSARATELVLSRSSVTGTPVRFSTNRAYLQRALALGCTDLQIVDGNAPILGEKAGLKYFWVTLGTENALKPSRKCLRIDSSTYSDTAPSLTRNRLRSHSEPKPHEEKQPPMTRHRTEKPHEDPTNRISNGIPTEASTTTSTPHQNGTSAQPDEETAKEFTVTDPLAAAEAVQDSLRAALTSTNRLIQVLRRNRKQARLVETTLASLRELQSVA
jgi:hypothetical protein